MSAARNPERRRFQFAILAVARRRVACGPGERSTVRDLPPGHRPDPGLCRCSEQRRSQSGQRDHCRGLGERHRFRWLQQHHRQGLHDILVGGNLRHDTALVHQGHALAARRRQDQPGRMEPHCCGLRRRPAAPLPQRRAVQTRNETGALPGNTLDLQIGSDPSYPHTPNGTIDEVRLWNVARTQDQIRSGMSGLTSAPPGLVALWPLNNNANDVVGGHNGTLHGGAAFALQRHRAELRARRIEHRALPAGPLPGHREVPRRRAIDR